VNVHFAKGDECKRLAMVEMGHGDEIGKGINQPQKKAK